MTYLRSIRAVALSVLFLATLDGIAQNQDQNQPPAPSASEQNQEQNQPQTNAVVTIPAGTHLALVLTQPVQSRYIHRGDDIYAQVMSPVGAGNEVVSPPGTFVQGVVDKIQRNGGRGELRLQSMSITFPDGYMTPIPGPMV